MLHDPSYALLTFVRMVTPTEVFQVQIEGDHGGGRGHSEQGDREEEVHLRSGRKKSKKENGEKI